MYLFASNNRILNQERIEDKFVRIRDFLQSNGLQINETKTFLTEFMTSQKRARLRGIPPELTITEKVEDKHVNGKFKLEDRSIMDSAYCRTLGCNLQNNLSWEAHLSGGKKAVLPAARCQLGCLYRLQHCLSKKVKLQLVNSLVVSKLTYSISLWGHATSNHMRKAQILLNLAARFVTGLNRPTSKRVLMSECGWLDVYELAEYYPLMEIF